MEEKNNQSAVNAEEIAAQINKGQRIAKIFGMIAGFLVAFPLACGYFIWMQTGSLNTILIPGILLLVVAIPFLLVYIGTTKRVFQLKKELKAKAKSDTEVKDNLQKRALYENMQRYTVSMATMPLLAVALFVARVFPRVWIIGLAVLGIAVFWLLRASAKKKLESLGGLSEEEMQSIKENTSKNNKAKTYVLLALAAILLIAYLLSGSGGKSSSSKDELSDEPWKELGVSKQEYMDVYNKFKYGL